MSYEHRAVLVQREVADAQTDLVFLKAARDKARQRCNATSVIEREIKATQHRLRLAQVSLRQARARASISRGAHRG